MSNKVLPQDILKKYSSQKISGATYYLHGHVLRAMMEYAKYAAEQANGAERSGSNCNITLVMESQFEAYAAFCIECDRQGMKPIKYKDYLEIG